MSDIEQPPCAASSEAVADPPRLRWIVAQEGSRESYSVPLAFHRLGALRLMYADIWCRFGRGLLRRGPAGARALATRFHPEIPGNLVVSFNRAAIFSKFRLHLGRSNLKSEQLSTFYREFGHWYAGKIRRHLEGLELDPVSDCFFGFNTNCLEALELLKERRVFTVVDQVDPARVEEDIVMQENARWPGWSSTPDRATEEYWQRNEAEWNLADAVLVNSEWSRQALIRQGVPSAKIIVVPLAIELGSIESRTSVNPDGPLKVLWLGSIILRKGIPYLVEAARSLERQGVQFLLAGPIGISLKAIESFPRNIKLLGRITRDQLSECYRQAHVFVLPTISDGFGVTQLEAMAHALPVITTPNCASVVTHGLDGFIVPPRDSEALAGVIALLDADRAMLRAMSAGALRTVQKYKIPSNAALVQQLVSQMKVRANP